MQDWLRKEWNKKMDIARCLHEIWLTALRLKTSTGAYWKWSISERKKKLIKMKKSGDWEKSVLCENISQPIKK